MGATDEFPTAQYVFMKMFNLSVHLSRMGVEKSPPDILNTLYFAAATMGLQVRSSHCPHGRLPDGEKYNLPHKRGHSHRLRTQIGRALPCPTTRRMERDYAGTVEELPA